MSRSVRVNFAVRSAAIMENVLTELGHTFSQVKDGVYSVAGGRYDIKMNCGEKGTIQFDSEDTGMVNGIKQAYSLAYYRDQAIREGMKCQETTQANGTIVLRLTHG